MVSSVLVFVVCLVPALAREVCQVTGDTKLGEGYNILTGEQCGEYCQLVPDCRHWTWYRRHCPQGWVSTHQTPLTL